MGAVGRIVDRLIAGDAPLTGPGLVAAARRLAAEEAPLDPAAASGAIAEVSGLGPLEPLLADPTVSDVLVNGPGDVWVERGGRMERSAVVFSGPDAIVAAVERVLAPLGLGIDRASPAVAARLPDGSRLHALIPPAAVDGPVLAIRRFTAAVPDLDAFVAAGSLQPPDRERLEQAVVDRESLVVSGATGSGKTTLLNALSKLIPPAERVVTVEDAAELRLSGHVVRLEARAPNAEGAGEITVQALVAHALRLRPDRLVVGEVRGPEALDLIQAMSTGHAGSMGTVHADGPEEALWRLEAMALMGERRVPADVVRRQLRSAVHLVVHMVRDGGRRRVASITAVEP